MKILTKEVLTAFIADSNQIYIAGMLSDKIEGVSFYAEFIRKPMIQKKHKVELLYSAVSDVQDGQEEENISLFHDELNFMGYIVDNETFYLFDAKKEDVEQLRLFGFEAGDMPENLKEMMKNEVEEYIRNKYIPEAKVLSSKPNPDSITKDSYYYAKNSAIADADDQTKAYKKAEKEMEKTAANDTVLLAQAQQRVQSMLEDYVKNMGTMLGKEYTITWDIKENHVKSDTAESTE